MTAAAAPAAKLIPIALEASPAPYTTFLVGQNAIITKHLTLRRQPGKTSYNVRLVAGSPPDRTQRIRVVSP